MGISLFGWRSESKTGPPSKAELEAEGAPQINAEGLEAMHAAGGAYTDAQVAAAEAVAATALASEASARVAGDAANATAITTEASARAAADTTLTTSVAAEKTRALAAEATLEGRFTGLVPQALTLTELRAGPPTGGYLRYLAARGLEGHFYTDEADTTSSDNGATVLVGAGGKRLKRVFTGGIRPEWFGAKGDVKELTTTTVEGTDDTEAFQKAHDALVAAGGGRLETDQTKLYLVNGTVYCNQTGSISAEWVPVYLTGLANTPAGSRGHAGAVCTNVANHDVFRVNMDASGKAVLPANEQYIGFAADISIVTKSVTASPGVPTTGVKGFNIFRTRSDIKMYGSRLDYLVFEAEKDASGNANYCDGSTYDLHCAFSTLHCARLSKNDSGELKRLTFESPLSTITGMLDLENGAGFSIGHILFHQTGTEWTPAVGSAMIKAKATRALKIEVLHIERQLPLERTIALEGCIATRIETVHTQYAGNTFLANVKSLGTEIASWYALDDRQGGKADIEVVGTAAENSVSWGAASLQLFNFTGGAARSPIIIAPSGFVNTRIAGGVVFTGSKEEVEPLIAALASGTRYAWIVQSPGGVILDIQTKVKA